MMNWNQQDMNIYNHQTYNSGMNHGYMSEYKCFTTQTHTQIFVSQVPEWTHNLQTGTSWLDTHIWWWINHRYTARTIQLVRTHNMWYNIYKSETEQSSGYKLLWNLNIISITHLNSKHYRVLNITLLKDYRNLENREREKERERERDDCSKLVKRSSWTSGELERKCSSRRRWEEKQ